MDDYWEIGDMNEDNVITKITYCLKKDENLKCEKPKINLTNSLSEFECLKCQNAQGIVVDIPESNN